MTSSIFLTSCSITVKRCMLFFGDNAPYCIPKVKNVKLLYDIGLKNTVYLDDALSVLEAWRRSEKPFRASISQVLHIYMELNEHFNAEDSRELAFTSFHICSVFIWFILLPKYISMILSFLQEQAKSTCSQFGQPANQRSFSKMLCNLYPGLEFFFCK